MNNIVEELLEMIKKLKEDILELEQEEAKLLFSQDNTEHREE